MWGLARRSDAYRAIRLIAAVGVGHGLRVPSWFIIVGSPPSIAEPKPKLPAMTKSDSPLSKLPSVSELLKHPRLQGMVHRINQTTLAHRTTSFVEEMQSYLRRRAGQVPSIHELAERFARHLSGEQRSGAPVVNATGVVLGAEGIEPAIADQAARQMLHMAGEYHTAQQGADMRGLAGEVCRLLCEQTGAEAAWIASSTDGAQQLLRTAFAGECEVVVADFAGLIDPEQFGLASITTIRAHLAKGCELLLVEGSGMLGGPACGILLGRRSWIDQLAEHALAAALAANSLTITALWATLDLYQADEQVTHQIPTLQLLSTPLENLQQRAERLAPLIEQSSAIAEATARLSESTWCQTANHQQTASTWIISLRPTGDAHSDATAQRFCDRLREDQWPLFARVADGSVVLDMRSVFPRWDQQLVSAIENLGE